MHFQDRLRTLARASSGMQVFLYRLLDIPPVARRIHLPEAVSLRRHCDKHWATGRCRSGCRYRRRSGTPTMTMRLDGDSARNVIGSPKGSVDSRNAASNVDGWTQVAAESSGQTYGAAASSETKFALIRTRFGSCLRTSRTGQPSGSRSIRTRQQAGSGPNAGHDLVCSRYHHQQKSSTSSAAVNG